MEIDDRIARAKDLIQKREEINTELAGLFGIGLNKEDAPVLKVRRRGASPIAPIRETCASAAGPRRVGWGRCCDDAQKRSPVRPAFGSRWVA
jgi:hypothetical protein